MKKYLSPKDLAGAIGVSESSLKRWTDDGRITAQRTAGGHRRIAVYEAIRFARSSHCPLVRPDLLGFPDLPTPEPDLPVDAGLDERFHLALVHDDSRSARALICWAYLGGTSIATLCDGPIREALTRIGHRWQHEHDGILVEHRAVDTCLQILNLLRGTLPPHGADAPAAVGCAPTGDPYLLPSLMAATTLAESGMRDVNLGANTPMATLRAAIERYQPRVCWLALSLPDYQPQFWSDLSDLAGALGDTGVHVVLGGRGLGTRTPPARHNLTVATSMSQLAGYARGLGELALR